MDTSRIALLIGTIGAGLMLVLLLVPNALLSMFRPVPEAPTPAPTQIVEDPTEAPTTTPVPLPTPAPAPTGVPTEPPATDEPEQADNEAIPEDSELAAYQQGLLDAINCAREQVDLPGYTINAEITQVAYDAGEQLAADLDLFLEDVVGEEYYIQAVIPIGPDDPQQGCSYYGFDGTMLLPELEDVDAFGIAVYPSYDYTLPEAIILGRIDP